MPKVKQPNFSKIRSILHEYGSEFTSTPKGESFCKFCDCLVKSNKRFVVEAHRRSAKHQPSSFHKTESCQIFLKHTIPDLQKNYFLFYFNRTNLSVCLLILCMNMLWIPHFNWKSRKLIGQNKVKIW